jgi:hypothetical protein
MKDSSIAIGIIALLIMSFGLGYIYAALITPHKAIVSYETFIRDHCLCAEEKPYGTMVSYNLTTIIKNYSEENK